MHRHGYQGRKFGRERDQRRALIKGLATAVIEYEKIETTLPKAKEVVPYLEKLITHAKKADLHHRRLIIASLATENSAHKLVDEIAPKLTGRNSGHLRIEKTRMRRGDLAQMAQVSFVDDLSATVSEKPVVKPKKVTEKAEAVAKPVKVKATTTAKKKPVATKEKSA